MYKCYTSYTSNSKMRKADGFKIPVSNRIYIWDGYSDHFSQLAPDMRWVEYLHNQLKVTQKHKDKFTEVYLLKLDRLKEDGTLDKYVEDIRNRLNYDNVFLLCYEPRKKFCHRHILAQYLNEHYDLDIQEF